MGSQPAGGVGEEGVVDLIGELDRLLQHGTVGQHHHQEGQPRAEADQLHRADGRRLVGRTHDHGSAVGEVGEEPRGPLEHLLDLPVGVVEEPADLLATARVERAGAHVVDEEPVPLVGRDPARTGVGLGQVPLALQTGHVRAHRGGRDAHPRGVDHVLGADRLGRADVLGDHCVEDGGLTGVHVSGGLAAVRLPRPLPGPSHLCDRRPSASSLIRGLVGGRLPPACSGVVGTPL